jgi:organic hydroperoxide reductase OsmC/OhrA
LGSGTSAYGAYSRAHEYTGEGKSAPIPGSSDPAFRGDPARYSPEELLVGALSTCHMLWVLHLCADAGIVVTEYDDEAWGEMVEHADGSGEMTRVVLRPRMRITDSGRAPDVEAIHDRAHAGAVWRAAWFPQRRAGSVGLRGTGVGQPILAAAGFVALAKCEDSRLAERAA